MLNSHNIYPHSGPIRGLVHVARLAINRPYPVFVRNLLDCYSGELPREMGTCRWCGQPVTKPARLWHRDCDNVHFGATGKPNRDKSGLWEKYGRWKDGSKFFLQCAECGKKDLAGCMEWDHKTALSVAWESGLQGDRRWWRAWLPENYRPLCHDCHRKKTTLDKRELKDLRTKTSRTKPEEEIE